MCWSLAVSVDVQSKLLLFLILLLLVLQHHGLVHRGHLRVPGGAHLRGRGGAAPEPLYEPQTAALRDPADLDGAHLYVTGSK